VKPQGIARRRGLTWLASIAVAIALPLTVVFLVASGTSTSSPDEDLKLPAASAAIPPSKTSHIFVVMLENRSLEDVIGNESAPFMNEMARRGALATQSYGIIHPSAPNYLAITGGSTFGMDTNCLRCSYPGRSIVDQMEEAGISWKGYMEGLPEPCFDGTGAGRYTKRHNPFAYYERVMNDPARCARVQPLANLIEDLTLGRLPTYSWLSPDLCHDAHDCSLAVADRFLSQLLPFVEQALGPHGYLVFTWDEGNEEDYRRCCGGSDGGRIATIVVGPDVKPGFRYRARFDHYAILRTIEQSLGLPPLRHAADPRTRTLDPMFRRPPRLR
jgi:hypothetical protein